MAAPLLVTLHNLATGEEGMPTTAGLQVVKDVQMVAPLLATLHDLATGEEGMPITALLQVVSQRRTTAPRVRVRSGPLVRPLEIHEDITLILDHQFHGIHCPIGYRFSC